MNKQKIDKYLHKININPNKTPLYLKKLEFYGFKINGAGIENLSELQNDGTISNFIKSVSNYINGLNITIQSLSDQVKNMNKNYDAIIEQLRSKLREINDETNKFKESLTNQ